MKVAIIGAGIAGLTAARAFFQRGIEVKVFEKSRGLGGRVCTKRFDWGNVDIGAQYFTARDKRFLQQVKQWRSDNVVDIWPFSPYVLTEEGLRKTDSTTLRYVGVPGMNSIAHSLARNLDIAFSQRVNGLEQVSGGWRLIGLDTEYEEERYDWVILSLPLAQSRSLLEGTPVEHRIPKDVLDPCWAVALATTGDVNPDIQGVFGDHVVSWVSRLSSRQQASRAQTSLQQRASSSDYDDLWMLHFSSDWSAHHQKHTHIDVPQIALEWLSSTLKTPLKRIYDYKHYWRYARNRNLNCHTGAIVDTSINVGLVGDWLNGGRVEGAYLSGLGLVDRLFR